MAPVLQSTDSSTAVTHKLRSLEHVDLPGLGIEAVSPALTGGFFITEVPGNPHIVFYQPMFALDDPTNLKNLTNLFSIKLKILKASIISDVMVLIRTLAESEAPIH